MKVFTDTGNFQTLKILISAKENGQIVSVDVIKHDGKFHMCRLGSQTTDLSPTTCWFQQELQVSLSHMLVILVVFLQ